MTPLHLELMIHFTVSDAPFPRPSGAASDYTNDLLERGLVQKTAYGYGATNMGRAFVHLACDTPLPVSGFFDPRDGQRINTQA